MKDEIITDCPFCKKDIYFQLWHAMDTRKHEAKDTMTVSCAKCDNLVTVKIEHEPTFIWTGDHA